MNSSRQQNMKYELIIFDFDGTIADTSEGILDSHRYALSVMGHTIPSDDELRDVIGGHLLNIYKNKFGFSENNARVAVDIYRKRYADVGRHKAVLYPGFIELLKHLKENGYLIGLATLKVERFAVQMLKELDCFDYFDVVCGMDDHDDLDKAGLVLKCCELCGVDNKNAILIGDSNNDYLGAKEACVSFLGVTYGFGFKRNEEYEFNTSNTTLDILKMII